MTFIFDNGIQPGGGGGGSSVTVDQTYDATSTNPQSGTAVAEAIATVDLSDYATTAQLDDKQDVLTPNAPITIAEYTKSSIYNMDYTSGNTGVYSSNTSRYVNYIENASISGSNFSINGQLKTSGSAPSTLEEFWDIGYIDIPFEFNKTYTAPYVGNNDSSKKITMIGGKIVNGNFVPILYATNGGNFYNDTIIINTNDDNFSFNGTSSIALQYNGGATSSTFNRTFVSLPLQVGIAYALSIKDDNGILINLMDTYGRNFNNFYSGSTTVSDVSLINRLREIQIMRLCIGNEFGTSSSYPIPLASLGRFPYKNLNELSAMQTQSDLGTNEFNISDVQLYNYLDLHIGSGLAVQGGNLVNTNPPIVTTTSTDYGQLTPDSGTLYIITDTGAIYLGSTLIAQKNT